LEARNWDRFKSSLTDEDGLRIRRKPLPNRNLRSTRRLAT
jgi:hypothetical protein